MYKSIKDIPNPFKAFDEVKDEKYFTGRKRELEKFDENIKTYINSNQRKNFLIIGDKSLGKSSLLHQIKHKFLEKDVLTILYTIREEKAKSALIFLKELIDEIIHAGESHDFLNKVCSGERFSQYEIWEALTISGEHESNRNERNLYISDIYQYALKSNNYNISISDTKILKDFEYLYKEAKNYGYNGIAILIDELQLLAVNDEIIQLLLSFIQNLENVVFVICGDYRLKSESFEKILRHSEQIEIFPFNTQHEILDMIYKPINNYGFTREEINEILDRESISLLIDRKDFNPYHLNLILYYMFENYKAGKNKNFYLDAEVTNEVIDKLKNIAPHHERITSQLNASNIDRLEAFQRLFTFQNINLYDIALITNNFQPITSENIQNKLKNILSDLYTVDPMRLFNIKILENYSIKDLIDLEEIPDNLAADIRYTFIGDSIDSVYASYLIQSRLRKDLFKIKDSDTIKVFADRLGLYLENKLSGLLKIKESDLPYLSGYEIIDQEKAPEITSAEISENIQYLNDISSSEGGLKKDSLEKLSEVLQVTSLDPLPHFAQIIGHDSGFYFFFAKVRIRYKIIFYRLFIPYIRCEQETFPIYPTEAIKDNVLNDYNIEIMDSVILNIHPKVILFIKTIDLHDYTIRVLRNIYSHKYDEALRLLEIQKSLDPKSNYIDNNIGFVHLANNELIQAEKYFNKVTYKQYTTYCNLGYLQYKNGRSMRVKQNLKKALNSLKNFKDEDNKFLAMHQILLPPEKRENMPKYWDIIFDVNANIVINGNLMILASLSNLTHCLGLLNKLVPESDLEKIYINRYKSWANFNLKKFDKATDILRKIKEDMPDTSHREFLEEIIEMDLSYQLRNRNRDR